MGKRSKFRRDSIRATNEWFEAECIPRITEKDKKILRFIHYVKIATSTQIANLFWEGEYKSKYCSRRLRILYDLHCIDRFFPLTTEGSSPQHIYLDYVGAKILGVNFVKIDKIPVNYRHTTLVSEFICRAYMKNLGWGEKERRIENVICDIYYPESKLAVEIDTGTESLKTIEKKGESYSSHKLNIIFVTTHIDRAEIFFSSINSDNKNCIKIATLAKDINKSLDSFIATNKAEINNPIAYRTKMSNENWHSNKNFI